MLTAADPALLAFSAGGVSLVIDVGGTVLPRVLYWGGELGLPAGPVDASNAVLGWSPQSPAVPLIPLQSVDWVGRPGLQGDRSGQWPHPRLLLTEPVAHRTEPDGGFHLTVHAADQEAGLDIVVELRLTPQGLIQLRSTLTNTGEDVWSLAALRAMLPLPDAAEELLDFTGRWGRERTPQRSRLVDGAHLRETWQGKPGHDAPTLLVAGTPGFGFRHGEVWAAHVAWSGDTELYAERFAERTAVLCGAERLLPGEVRLSAGSRYRTPWVHFAYSPDGLDGIGDRFHALLRARPQHPKTPRRVHINNWEATYFDHDLDRLMDLVGLAAAVGAERFVLDDGWFCHRRDDRAGLGDWFVDETVYPDGLHPLIKHVHGLGLDFGLWFEPEMVNPDSDLYRQHPDWVLAAPGRLPSEARNQHILDLANPDAFAYVLGRIDAILTEYPIGYVKWDHNRPLMAAVHQGAAGVHAQTLAVYRLIDTVRDRHPHLEIESCSGGGARTDLGMVQRTDRVWASDNLDAVDRQRIQRWTGLLLPPELLGTHVGQGFTHATGRAQSLSLRCATSLFGHAGIEWDLGACTPDELAELTDWVAAYKRLRPLIHTGRSVRPDLPDESALLHGIVAADHSRAVFTYVQLEPATAWKPRRLPLPGLDPDTVYRISVTPELARYTGSGRELSNSPVTAQGRVLARLGLGVRPLPPGEALVFEAEVLDRCSRATDVARQ
ncbi:alpha-galactosidase [Streptacidiphilus sp. EB103A]|uniref:alpha-galactosidase n=1 Tax=Streptacidiphilus sp. EB103A TaxID=3156275 RepID=UPI003515BFE7